MKTSVTRTVIAVVAVLAIASLSNALTLTTASSSYVGHVKDGIPSNLTDEAGYINALITLGAGAGQTVIGSETYDRLGSSLAGPFDPAVVAGAVKSDRTPAQGSSIDANGFEYVLGKYDGDKAGSLVWYVAGGFSGEVTLPALFGQYELSHISLFNASPRVPEGGSTITLLGLVLGILALVRRQIK